MEHSKIDYENCIHLNRSMSSQYELPIMYDQKDIAERTDIAIEMHTFGHELEGDEYESIKSISGDNIIEITGTQNVTNAYNGKIYDNNIGNIKLFCVFSKWYTILKNISM